MSGSAVIPTELSVKMWTLGTASNVGGLGTVTGGSGFGLTPQATAHNRMATEDRRAYPPHVRAAARQPFAVLKAAFPWQSIAALKLSYLTTANPPRSSRTAAVPPGDR